MIRGQEIYLIGQASINEMLLTNITPVLKLLTSIFVDLIE